MDGGLEAWRGIRATGGFEQGLELIEGLRSAEDLLPVAIALEEGSRIFYSQVAEVLNDEEAKILFGRLAKAEEAHKRTIHEACRSLPHAADCSGLEGREELRGFMEGAASIDEALDWVRAPDRTPSEVLELAMQIEANSLDLYIKIAGRDEFRPVLAILEGVIEEEKGHLRRLGSLLEKSVP